MKGSGKREKLKAVKINAYQRDYSTREIKLNK